MTTGWDMPAGPPSLPADELHVWRVSLDLSDEAVASLQTVLAPDEHARADRFRLPRDRRRFIVARGTLRVLLGHVLDRSPAGLAFTYGPHGKPALTKSPTVPWVAFNLSHSADLALIALCWGADVGVDIERIRDGWEWEGVAERFFCADEIAWLYSLPADRQTAGFFRLWARKEAYLKARGGGVWHDLSRFDVTQTPMRELDAASDPSRWHIEDLEPGGHCRAAVSVKGSLPTLRTWHWAPPGR